MNNSNLKWCHAILGQRPLRQQHGCRLQLKEEVAAQLGEARVYFRGHFEELFACGGVVSAELPSDMTGDLYLKYPAVHSSEGSESKKRFPGFREYRVCSRHSVNVHVVCMLAAYIRKPF